jgi:hypothetical protein
VGRDGSRKLNLVQRTKSTVLRGMYSIKVSWGGDGSYFSFSSPHHYHHQTRCPLLYPRRLCCEGCWSTRDLPLATSGSCSQRIVICVTTAEQCRRCGSLLCAIVVCFFFIPCLYTTHKTLDRPYLQPSCSFPAIFASGGPVHSYEDSWTHTTMTAKRLKGMFFFLIFYLFATHG